VRTLAAAIVGALLLPLGCGLPLFACEGDDQCTLSAQGVCQANGYCSYPDPACPSGQRYSEHAGPLGRQCVGEGDDDTGPGPIASDSTDTLPSADETTEGDTDGPCLDVDCGPHGRCQVDGTEPTCVCDDGFERQDMACVEGCPGSTCLWVDAVEGDDANPGTTRAMPLRTLARAAELAPALAPGEALVLRRGQVWDEALVLTGLAGTEVDPIVVGAYDGGDGATARPRVGDGLRLEASVGVRVQHLAVNDANATAVRLVGVSHATVLDCEVFDAAQGCILVSAGSEYTALVGNTAWSCGDATPIYGIALTETGGGLGDHHWVVDNRIDAEGTTNALHLTLTSADDVKAVRNMMQGSRDRGLHSRIGGHAWLVSNVVANAGDDNDPAFDHDGAGEVIARGNIVLDAMRPVNLGGRGEWAFNTVVHQQSLTAVGVPSGATGWSFHDNLVMAGSSPSIDVAMVADLTTEHDVYDAGCTFQAGGMLLDLAGWQALGQDSGSRCEAVPGPAIPASVGSTRDWDDAWVVDVAAPDPGWRGCDDPVGALDCEGLPLAAALPPFDDIGHGWPGPPEVVERVELAP